MRACRLTVAKNFPQVFVFSTALLCETDLCSLKEILLTDDCTSSLSETIHFKQNMCAILRETVNA